MEIYNFLAAKDYDEVRQIGGQFSVTYKDVFNFEYLYKGIMAWLEEEGYGPMGKWHEKLYTERVASNGAKEHWIWWRTKKDPAPYFQYMLNVDFHTLYLQNTEIMHDGKKMKTNSGEIEIFLRAQLFLDPKGLWKKHWLLKHEFIRKMWKKRIYHAEIDQQETLLYRDVYRLQNHIKQYFELKGFMHEYAGEPFVSIKGSSYP